MARASAAPRRGLPRAGSETDFEGLKGYFAAMRQAFGDFSVTRGHVLVDGRWAAAQTRMAGVFEREFSASPVGPLPPTGRGFVLDLQNIFRYDDSCKLVDEWAQYDLRGMLAQLGAAGRVEPGRPRGCAKRCAPPSRSSSARRRYRGAVARSSGPTLR